LAPFDAVIAIWSAEVSVSVADAVLLLFVASFTVTLIVVELDWLVVPLINPPALSVRPVGSVLVVDHE
jgi:hypothetical protein